MLSPFPPIIVPFPVQSNYTIRADLARMLENNEPRSSHHFHIDAAYFDYVKEKLHQLQTYPELCHVYSNVDKMALTTIAWRIFKKLAEEYPEYVVMDDGVKLSILVYI